MIANVLRRVAAGGLSTVDLFEGTAADLNGLLTSDGKATWQKFAGTIGKSGGLASGAGSSSIYVLDAKSPRYNARLRIATPNSRGGDCLYFRVADTSNWWRIRYWQDTGSTLVADHSYTHTFIGQWHYVMGHYHSIVQTSVSTSPTAPPTPTSVQPPLGPHTHDFPIQANTPHTHPWAGWAYTGAKQNSGYATMTYGIPRVSIERCVAGAVTVLANIPVQLSGSHFSMAVTTTSTKIVIDIAGARRSYDDQIHSSFTKVGIGRGPSSYSTGSGMEDFTLTKK